LISNKKIKLIRKLFTLIGLIFSVGGLVGLITAKVAFPIMYTCIGCVQLINGLTLNTKNKSSKLLSISFGILFIIFGVIIVPTFYFYFK